MFSHFKLVSFYNFVLDSQRFCDNNVVIDKKNHFGAKFLAYQISQSELFQIEFVENIRMMSIKKYFVVIPT